MLLKVSKVVKVLLTVLANVNSLWGFLVLSLLLCIKMEGGQVLIQGALPRVRFAAVAAHVRLLQQTEVRFHVLLEVVVQLEGSVALATPERVVHLRNLDLHHLHVLQYLGGCHRFFLIEDFLYQHRQRHIEGHVDRASLSLLMIITHTLWRILLGNDKEKNNHACISFIKHSECK